MTVKYIVPLLSVLSLMLFLTPHSNAMDCDLNDGNCLNQQNAAIDIESIFTDRHITPKRLLANWWQFIQHRDEQDNGVMDGSLFQENGLVDCHFAQNLPGVMNFIGVSPGVGPVERTCLSKIEKNTLLFVPYISIAVFNNSLINENIPLFEKRLQASNFIDVGPTRAQVEGTEEFDPYVTVMGGTLTAPNGIEKPLSFDHNVKNLRVHTGTFSYTGVEGAENDPYAVADGHVILTKLKQVGWYTLKFFAEARIIFRPDPEDCGQEVCDLVDFPFPIDVTYHFEVVNRQY